MSSGLIFSLFLLGLNSIAAQVIILRELTITFYGNEFFIGVVLACWFILVAIGSGILSKALDRLKNHLLFLIALHLIVPVFLLGEILLIRVLKNSIGLPGEIPNLIYAILMVLFINAPLCLLLGLWWTTAVRIFSNSLKENQNLIIEKSIENSISCGINKAYFLEIFGFIFGGILFSFVLVNLQEFLAISILFILNIESILFLIWKKNNFWRVKITTILLFLVIVFLISSSCLDNFNQKTLAFRFSNQELLESKNTPYGNIAVTKINNQYNFYESGLFLGSSQEFQFAENFAHLSLLQFPLPKKILLIGGGLTVW